MKRDNLFLTKTTYSGTERVFWQLTPVYHKIPIPQFRWPEWTHDNFEYESSLLFPTNMWQSKLNVTDTPCNVITITSPSFDINQTFPLLFKLLCISNLKLLAFCIIYFRQIPFSLSTSTIYVSPNYSQWSLGSMWVFKRHNGCSRLNWLKWKGSK